jgi:hypothetical protein
MEGTRLASGAAGIGEADGATEADADTEAAGVTEADADTEADAVTEADGDAEADGDTEADADGRGLGDGDGVVASSSRSRWSSVFASSMSCWARVMASASAGSQTPAGHSDSRIESRKRWALARCAAARFRSAAVAEPVAGRSAS